MKTKKNPKVSIRKNPDKTDQELLDEYFELEDTQFSYFSIFGSYCGPSARRRAIENELGQEKIDTERLKRRLDRLEKKIDGNIEIDNENIEIDNENAKKVATFVVVISLLLSVVVASILYLFFFI